MSQPILKQTIYFENTWLEWVTAKLQANTFHNKCEASDGRIPDNDNEMLHLALMNGEYPIDFSDALIKISVNSAANGQYLEGILEIYNSIVNPIIIDDVITTYKWSDFNLIIAKDTLDKMPFIETHLTVAKTMSMSKDNKQQNAKKRKKHDSKAPPTLSNDMLEPNTKRHHRDNDTNDNNDSNDSDIEFIEQPTLTSTVTNTVEEQQSTQSPPPPSDPKEAIFPTGELPEDVHWMSAKDIKKLREHYEKEYPKPINATWDSSKSITEIENSNECMDSNGSFDEKWIEAVKNYDFADTSMAGVSTEGLLGSRVCKFEPLRGICIRF